MKDKTPNTDPPKTLAACLEQVHSMGMVEPAPAGGSIRRIQGKSTIERLYYLSSLPRDARRFAKAVRNHRGVENPLRWTLGVTFGEDQSHARTKYAAPNPATLRRISLNLIQKHPRHKVSQRQQCILAARDTTFLQQLLRF